MDSKNKRYFNSEDEEGKKNPLKMKKKSKVDSDPYPGKAPVDSERMKKHSRGEKGVSFRNIKGKFNKKEMKKKEKDLVLAQEIAARNELLLPEDENAGFLEGDERLHSSQVRQTQIRDAVDPESADKGFDLSLPKFGPYKLDYTRNGRHLLLGGRRGHIAAIDWQSKDLLCEINVMESVHDVKWLHTEQMFAVAQKKWTFIYDNQGIELHCLKKLDNITKLEFLPYHFLLFASSDRGYLSWVDVSIGKMVAQFNGKVGPLDRVCQNPWNAVICCGHSKGTVTMWTPNVQEPVAKILCHRHALSSIAVESSGNYMATCGVDRTLKIWDVRNTFEAVYDYRLPSGASNLVFSGNGSLGLSRNNVVEIYKNPTRQKISHSYMRHKVFKNVSDLKFAPFEDVLGIGHGHGFSSILVPGSGLANFDTLEVNPYQTKKQRREAEVKSLLDKIQPELITLDPTRLGEVDVMSLEKTVQENNEKPFIKPKDIDFKPRVKGGIGSAKQFHIKRTLADEERRKNIKQVVMDNEKNRIGTKKKEKKSKGLLDRLA
ncbi:WD repeat-containing protein 46 [Lepeophtheirus salmonis]|uniref:BING4 C-terminal domain-containing protein n=1 Tax=Lepeophtheirus salmonis TaxID=72036 RepID=A0A0K2V7G6_LEPSM|nr:WD repeat-containing protein 46-like [Lepeophtheirus salmonis]